MDVYKDRQMRLDDIAFIDKKRENTNKPIRIDR
jgi:hypothetical protein